MTDGAKTVVWDAVYKPFGEAHSITGSASLNLRFPGQYYLLEHGLAYNWHRYYDPTTGRYTRPDPIADNRLTAAQRDTMRLASTSAMPLPFQDGPSVYAYARSASIQNVDPTGQIAWMPIVIGIGAGVALDYAASSIKAAVCTCSSSSVGPVASGAVGGAAGLFGPFAQKRFGALGSGLSTSSFSQLIGAGYSSGYFGLGLRNALRAVGSVASYVGPLGFIALAGYHAYSIGSCASQ